MTFHSIIFFQEHFLIANKTDFEKLSATDQASISKLSSNSNILEQDSTAEPGIEKAIIVAGKAINEIRAKMDDLFYGKFEIAADDFARYIYSLIQIQNEWRNQQSTNKSNLSKNERSPFHFFT
jgi:hypothetical protein